MINKKTKILFVTNRACVKKQISNIPQCKYEILFSDTPVDCLKLKSKHHVKIIFIDLELGKKIGYNLCEEIRSTDQISFLCAIAENTHVFGLSKCREIGFDDYLTRLDSKEELLQTIYMADKSIKKWLSLIISESNRFITHNLSGKLIPQA